MVATFITSHVIERALHIRYASQNLSFFALETRLNVASPSSLPVSLPGSTLISSRPSVRANFTRHFTCFDTPQQNGPREARVSSMPISTLLLPTFTLYLASR